MHGPLNVKFTYRNCTMWVLLPPGYSPIAVK